MLTSTFDVVAKAILQDALAFADSKSGLQDSGKSRLAIRDGDCAVCEYLRHGVAQAVAKYLGETDEAIKAVYAYQPEYATMSDALVDGQPRRSPGINLIAWVNRKTAALSSLLAMLGAAISEEFQLLGCPKGNALCGLLDVQLVDDADIVGRSGYGALVDSLYVRPMQVWHRLGSD